ncbi:MAG TPA: phenylalanine--tRNA ligase subunit beta [Bacteroidia bacterium]|nr:phenylalanine--tRNA ligase subunit beta [Bacteroidia bacterium]
MKISRNWLNTILPNPLEADDTAKILTSTGLEVESLEHVEALKGGLRGVVVGQVMSCEKHPDADRLKVCKVDIGQTDFLNIVCGAPNVENGQKVLVATVGTTLYPFGTDQALLIKQSRIRGVQSEGMICAEDELGLGKGHDGILVLPEDTTTGTQASVYFNLEQDTVFEIGLTPNRSDAASHLGVARDLAAKLNSSGEAGKFNIELQGMQSLPDATGINVVKISLEHPEGCKRYSGLVLSGVKVGESPDWLKRRLSAIGLRPINNIVDVGNFVMFELGQPLHAFDLEAIKGSQVVIRTAREGESLLMLDNVNRKFKPDDLLICNEDGPMCLAGVFGGLHSGVNEHTTSVFLESAYFEPAFVRRSAKRHGLKTDASFRFERGCDPDMCIPALTRAANLIMDICGAHLSMGITDVYPEKLEPHKVAFSYSNCNELIGKEIDRHLIKQIILNLGIEISSEGSDGLLLHVPFYKHDVLREADVVEEVMRIYGYDNVEPSKQITYHIGLEDQNQALYLDEKCAALLESNGFHEMMNLSLSRENFYENGKDLVKLLNPLSQELNVLRRDMLFSGLECIAYNLNRKNQDLKLFEFGKSYSLAEKPGTYQESKHLSLFCSGYLSPENPYHKQEKSDFAYLKACVESVLHKCGIVNWKCEESASEQLTYGLRYAHKNSTLVEFGHVQKMNLRKFDIQQDVYYACFNLDILFKAASLNNIRFQEIPRFPAVRRDLALLLDKKVQYKEVEDLAYQTEKKLLSNVNLFDIYQDEKLGPKKSYALSFTLLDKDATLTDQQIEKVMSRLVTAYKEKLGAELR